MEAEYIALSISMHDLIPLCTLVDLVRELIGTSVVPCQTLSKVFEDNNGALTLAMTLIQFPPEMDENWLRYELLN